MGHSEPLTKNTGALSAFTKGVLIANAAWAARMTVVILLNWCVAFLCFVSTNAHYHCHYRRCRSNFPSCSDAAPGSQHITPSSSFSSSRAWAQTLRAVVDVLPTSPPPPPTARSAPFSFSSTSSRRHGHELKRHVRSQRTPPLLLVLLPLLSHPLLPNLRLASEFKRCAQWSTCHPSSSLSLSWARTHTLRVVLDALPILPFSSSSHASSSLSSSSPRLGPKRHTCGLRTRNPT